MGGQWFDLCKLVSPWRELEANIETRLAGSAPSPSKQLSGSLLALMSRWLPARHPTSGSMLVCVCVCMCWCETEGKHTAALSKTLG